MIDPQSQANRWVKRMGKRDNLQVIQMNEGTLRSSSFFLPKSWPCFFFVAHAHVRELARDCLLFMHVFLTLFPFLFSAVRRHAWRRHVEEHA